VFGTAQRFGLGVSPLTEDMYYSIQTEEEFEQLLMQELVMVDTKKRPRNRIAKWRWKSNQ
jgi:hypothetical protein